jgi:DNA-directed RNA polymerase
MDWLREVAKVAATAGLPLWWTTPTGLPILQEYKKQEGTRVAAFWGGQRIRLVLQTESSSICSRSQVNGVAPNFVHSLDAAHLQSVALQAKKEGIRDLAVIHDSFGTHAANTGKLSRILRETFVKQYSGNVLQDFYDEIKDQLGEELGTQLPLPPSMGGMDLGEILSAEYTFA